MLMHMLSLLVIHVLPSVRGFRSWIAVFLGVLMMIAGFAMARRGLATFAPLRERLMAVRRREASLVEGAYPVEVQPLVDDLNALLAERENAVERAQRTAADLAHELKTPLALLVQEAERLAASGNEELAESIGAQVERMTRQVDYHLARARAAASGARGAAPCGLASCVDGLVRTMAKLYSGRGLALVSTVAEDVQVRVQREDLEEMLGNLMDNACKWGRGQVRVSAARVGAMVEIAVEDDGPGIEASMRARVLERGVRADQSRPGSGLGLAIVRDLAELYGGAVALCDASIGGLRVELRVPG